MSLFAFETDDFQQLIEWISSEELNYLWGGPAYSYPLDDAQILSHCSKSEVFPYIYRIDGKNAGFVELYKESHDQMRVCRVFVANQFRGQGISKMILLELIDKAKVEFHAQSLSLGVFSHNDAAMNCYESLGFLVVSVESGSRMFNGVAWDLVRMEKRL
ncbi:GNAT family N-acetyltransferase [Vibrio scophthalmi]|uniref:Putative acetyltransferase n=1 Tax=Vibrio scophthalmi LMG 19158 TaxID=870967 RepID=F9RNV3_9VIBR|nr:GNAT family N-acetyltransferase [Vibrio scophthalmi]EGU36780.1 putative acetyltransferase [Vibrio scophthalmi LMG 19158]